MTNLYLIRGLPGSGKTTYVQSNNLGLHFEADQFFEGPKPGSYQFDFRLLSVAHDWCYSNTVKALRWGMDVAVSNTFTQLWELERYLAIPTLVDGVRITIVEMRTQYQNIHGVPESKMEVMRNRWQELSSDILESGITVMVIR